MERRKSFLYGLGSGLAAGALLLQLASIGQSGVLPSGEELEAAAAANGYVLKDAKTVWYSEEELHERLAETAEAARQQALQEARQAETIYAFTIGPGTELTAVAKLLYELGLIDDYNGFLMIMEERGLAGKVQAKHYRFQSVPDLEELIRELTS